jgi:hypothetical protein
MPLQLRVVLPRSRNILPGIAKNSGETDSVANIYIRGGFHEEQGLPEV